jgi:hypothetical protein
MEALEVFHLITVGMVMTVFMAIVRKTNNFIIINFINIFFKVMDTLVVMAMVMDIHMEFMDQKRLQANQNNNYFAYKFMINK